MKGLNEVLNKEEKVMSCKGVLRDLIEQLSK